MGLLHHLGNTVAMFEDKSGDNTVTNDEVIQRYYYYPFGAETKNAPCTQQPTPKIRYQYNGKEKIDELGLGWNDYGARNYDALLGRWMGVDALAEKYAPVSQYTYCLNNPIIMVDPNGKDNIIYILTLPSASKTAMKNVERELRGMLALGKINAQICMVQDYKSFDINKMDKTDAVAVVGGEKSSIVSHIRNNFAGWVGSEWADSGDPKDTGGKSLNSFLNVAENPEMSDGSGSGGWSYVTAVSTNRYFYAQNVEGTDAFGKTKNDAYQNSGLTDPSQYVAFNIFHGIGHISGLLHDGFGFMSNGSAIGGMLRSPAYSSNPFKVDSFIMDTYNVSASKKLSLQKINNRFPDSKSGEQVKPTLNYDPNH